MTAVITLPHAATYPARPKSRQLTVCPHCHKPVAGLLSGCGDTRCLSKECAEEQALDLRIEATDE